ncbi:MAG TPA: hypothetical protein ENN23_04080 [Deltaproteobacteria bacterium]|nr:hypothetical protein [Deltaproteobacteria bacterium]
MIFFAACPRTRETKNVGICFSYDEAKIRKLFEQISLISYLHDKGYTKIKIVAEKVGAFTSRLSVYDTTSAPENILIDTRFSETVFTPHAEFCAVLNEKREACSFNLIVIEWLETINPRADFSAQRPQLPGQKKTGPGGACLYQEIFAALGRRRRPRRILENRRSRA